MQRHANRKNITAVAVCVFMVVVPLILSLHHLSSVNKTIASGVTVRFAAPLTLAAAPAYVAEKKGFWKQAGVNVKVTYFNSGREALEALVSGSADLASVSETPPLRGYMHGHNIRIVTSISKNKEAKMTVRNDRIHKPSDIIGARIGTIPGTNSDYYMYTWLKEHKIGINEVNIIKLDPKGLSQAFIQGEIDAMFAWEPHNYNAYSKIPHLALSWATELYDGRQVVIMNKNYLDSNQLVAERLARALIHAEQFIEENPQESMKIVRESTGLSQSAVEALWPEYRYQVDIDKDLVAILEKESQWITLGKTSSSHLDLSQMVDARALRAVDATRVKGKF